ncbi:LOW QUALITY PROTEIN: leukocyte immunoglobulin-like receptor subfamily B member 3 [Diceros bicornis minor]|uniref:LOW QUALITY PROTEIN: leukocyte immunoglobulin-like receptor subfamily B member 3 n=1 Tax=Diceros bicornis minor TaxID=77932 RepID=UPI0026E9F3BA|nr:LOW QUALITY PROTEIN: leukocyte immunoglobulin-like receptor subfamily B member 3 [Diceros bicornis minor]
MGGRARTPTLTALLCLGLCQGPWDCVQSGSLPKPSIWADPGPMVTRGIPATIWCQGSLQDDVYHLYKERVSKPLATEAPQDSSNKISFCIESMSRHTVGFYQCAYNTSRNGWSECSDPLPLVLTGEYGAPSLSAHPGRVVAKGGNMSLSCSSESILDTFHLLKEGGADPPRHMELRNYPGRKQAAFPVGPVNTSHGGTYRCYGSHRSYPYVWSHPSHPLHLNVTGVYREPSLSAQPGSLVLSGDNLTLQCHSEAGFKRFALTKVEGLTNPQRLHGQHSPDFPLGHVNSTHRGQYRCFGRHNVSYAWSHPSAPLDILIEGMYEKPSLSAQPGPSVSWGENVTLQCRSEIWLDAFHLSKEGSLAPPQHLRLQDKAPPFQANFTISCVTSDHEGTYRCYSSDSTSPYLLSSPSNPLELRVSGLKSYLNVLIGVSVAFVLLISVLLLLLLIWHQGKHRMLAQRQADLQLPAGAADPEPKDRGLQIRKFLSSPAAEAQEETLYAAVKDTQPEEGVELDHQVAASEVPQDVTYAQLNHLTIKQEMTPPSSQPEKPPAEPSVYAALAIQKNDPVQE